MRAPLNQASTESYGAGPTYPVGSVLLVTAGVLAAVFLAMVALSAPIVTVIVGLATATSGLVVRRLWAGTRRRTRNHQPADPATPTAGDR